MQSTTTSVGEVSVLSRDGERAAANEVLLWDGRLDNREDLERSAPVASRRGSDPHAVLAVYDRLGVSGLGQVIGDWSIVIHDRQRNLLVLASDYAGVRPLYYHLAPGTMRWSTHLGSLAEAARIDELDEEYVRSLLERGGGAHRTPFAGIYTVPAGHAICVSAAGVRVERFWLAPVSTCLRYADEREYDAHVRLLFADAVGVRLRTEAPVVAELSGGLDSSSVITMADRLIRDGAVPAPSLKTVSYVHRDSTDLPYIQAVEAFRRSDGIHFSTHVDPLVSDGDVGGSMPAGWGPLYKATVRATRALGAKVLLTGQNGDLVMGNWFDDSLQVAAAVRRGQLGRAAGEALAWSKLTRVPMMRILSRAMLASLPPSLTPRSLYATELSAGGSCLTASFRKRTSAAGAPTPWADAWYEAAPERRRHFRALAYMREMRTLQRLEYAPEIDYTHPFAHRPLVEFLLSIPAEVLCRPGEPRRLMRRSLRHLWPARLQGRRSKSLFGAPWIEGLRPLAAGMLAAPRWLIVERGWVDRRRAAERLDRLIQGVEGDDAELRHVILLEYWLRHRERARHKAPAA